MRLQSRLENLTCHSPIQREVGGCRDFVCEAHLSALSSFATRAGVAAPTAGSFPILADQDLPPIKILPITPWIQVSLIELASQPTLTASTFRQTA